MAFKQQENTYIYSLKWEKTIIYGVWSDFSTAYDELDNIGLTLPRFQYCVFPSQSLDQRNVLTVENFAVKTLPCQSVVPLEF